MNDRPEFSLDRLAELAALELTEAERRQLPGQLAEIILHVESLAPETASGLSEGEQTRELSGATRPDRDDRCLSRDETLRNAPAHDREYFLVPPVFG